VSSPRRFPPSWSVEETDPTSISEEELARRSNRGGREHSRGGLAARVGLAHRAFRKGFLTIPNQIIWTPKPGSMLPPARLRGLEMIRASIYIASITALAAVLAIIATGITMQWQREHRATQLVKLANNIASCRNCPGDLESAGRFKFQDRPSFIGLTRALGQ
jgi:hypothetical protein